MAVCGSGWLRCGTGRYYDGRAIALFSPSDTRHRTSTAWQPCNATALQRTCVYVQGRIFICRQVRMHTVRQSGIPLPVNLSSYLSIL